MQNQAVPFFDYSVFANSLDQMPEKPAMLVNTINQYSYCVAENDADFKKALLGSDVLLPDGVAIVAAVKILTGQKIQKIAGADIHQYILQDLNRKSGSCFYLGASETTLKKITEKLALEYPNLRVGTFSPPYKPEFCKEETEQMIEAVNAFKADALFVGMTAPKQEKWAFENQGKLETKIICTIGAVFDFYAGTVERPGKFWISIGLEWLVRLLNEPKRLWKRYLYYGPVFIGYIIKEKFRKASQSKLESALTK